MWILAAFVLILAAPIALAVGLVYGAVVLTSITIHAVQTARARR